MSDNNVDVERETFASKAIVYFKNIEFPKSESTNKTANTNTTGTSTTKTKNKRNNKKREAEEINDEDSKPTRANKKKKKNIEINNSNNLNNNNNNNDNEKIEEVTEVVNGIMVMNPYKNPNTLAIFKKYLEMYFGDTNKRVFVLGINPGRLGGGITGIPFTDPPTIKNKLNIDIPELSSLPSKSRKEPSGDFIHSFISSYGGPKHFFSRFYITSLSPLGFMNREGNNYNFYDSKELMEASMPFILSSMRNQIPFGATRKVAICLGSGKLATIFKKINKENNFFDKILEVEHPRYIVQYKSSQREQYIEKYKQIFSQAWQLSDICNSD